MNRILILFALLSGGFVSAQVTDNIHVVTHKRVTVVTNPKTGVKDYPGWGVFPSKDVSVRKILLHLTLGSPDSMKTAHWDYCDNITILRQGGVRNESKNYQIARMLTPYGSIFGKGWQFEWTVDVTDFSSVLRDSVEIEYLHSGYEPDTVGWALTLDFEIVVGPEILKPMGIVKLWNDHYKYGDPEEKIESKLTPAWFETLPGSGLTRIRIQHTGHGMDEPNGCSEFCSRWRELYLDGRLTDHRVLWKDCGNNPLYPQGGTWIYDRANWCPGDLQQPDIIDFHALPGKHELSIKMEPYTATKNIQAVENICAYLFHCSKPLHKVDVSIEQIIIPNDHPALNRLNPAGFDPMIRIRNLGAENLVSVLISYGTRGFQKNSFLWKGNLAFNQSEEINLNGIIQGTEGNNIFEVSLDRPNGKRDAWEGDNSITSTFIIPVSLPVQMVVKLKTNNHPHDNTILLVNNLHDTLFSKLPGHLTGNTVYSDTLRLVEGNYRLILSDTAGDGLEFWAEPGQGNGYLRLLDIQGRLLHSFQSDCGNGLKLDFHASEGYTKDTSIRLNAFSLYPRNVSDRTELEVISDRPAKMTVIITLDGKVIEKHEYEKIQSGIFPFYLGYLPKGRIVLEALLDGKSCFKGRLFREKL